MPKRFSTLPKEEGHIHVALLTILVLGAFGLVASSNITTTQKFSASSPQVLGENETAQQAAEQAKEITQKTAEQQKENRRINTQSEGKRQETEIETSNGQKTKTKIEVEQGKLKLKYESEKGGIKLKTEDEQGKEVELKDGEMEKVQKEIENELEDEGIKISTESGKPTITKNKVTASTDFPLSVNVATHQLTVTTPAGQKTVTILPDQAVQNLLGVSSSAILSNLSDPIKLEIKDNGVVYKIKGEKKFKIFGFIPVSTPTTAYISAQSGKLVAQEQPLLTNLIKLVSPE